MTADEKIQELQETVKRLTGDLRALNLQVACQGRLLIAVAQCVDAMGETLGDDEDG